MLFPNFSFFADVSIYLTKYLGVTYDLKCRHVTSLCRLLTNISEYVYFTKILNLCKFELNHFGYVGTFIAKIAQYQTLAWFQFIFLLHTRTIYAILFRQWPSFFCGLAISLPVFMRAFVIFMNFLFLWHFYCNFLIKNL